MSKLSIKNSGTLYFCAKIFILDPLGEDPARPGPRPHQELYILQINYWYGLYLGQKSRLLSNGEP